MGVVLAEGLHVGELREGSLLDVGRFEGSFYNSKEIGAERPLRISIGADGIARVQQRHTGFGGPSRIVGAQRLAISIANERGTIYDFGRPGFRPLKILRLCEEGEPAAKNAFVVAAEAEEVGGAVGESVERSARAQKAGSGHERKRAPGHNGTCVPRPAASARRYARPAETTSSIP